MYPFGLIRVRSPLLTKFLLVSTPPGTEMFHFPGCASPHCWVRIIRVCRMGFPHSEISGSKLDNQLPEAYRRLSASFIAFKSLGIHHLLLVSIRNYTNHNYNLHFRFFTLRGHFGFYTKTTHGLNTIHVASYSVCNLQVSVESDGSR